MQINKLATGIETAFNVTNSIPVIAIPGAALRVNAAQVQLVSAAFFALLGFIGQMVQSGNSKWKGMFHYSCDHMMHGALNYIRGFGELLLAITIVGSLVPLIYQLSAKNGFAPIVKYEIPIYSQLHNATAPARK